MLLYLPREIYLVESYPLARSLAVYFHDDESGRRGVRVPVTSTPRTFVPSSLPPSSLSLALSFSLALCTLRKEKEGQGRTEDVDGVKLIGSGHGGVMSRGYVRPLNHNEIKSLPVQSRV